MDNFLKIVVYLVSVELFRRLVMKLIGGFTGPLAKVPGPFLAKFTAIPWLINAAQGEQMNTGPELIKKYGDVVRAGEYDLDGW
jgi:hypothetical protein